MHTLLIFGTKDGRMDGRIFLSKQHTQVRFEKPTGALLKKKRC